MKLFKTLLPLIAALLSGAAVAHPGGEHVHGFLAGAAHPLLGIDHLLVMLAVGIWSAQQAGRRVWLWPAAFVLAMLGGNMLGMAGVQLSWLETGIATSALLLGLLVAAAARLPQVLGAALCAAMACLHGIAHGAELPADANAGLFGLGFLAATAMLHLVGIALTRALREMPSLARYFGGGIALTGGLMLLG